MRIMLHDQKMQSFYFRNLKNQEIFVARFLLHMRKLKDAEFTPLPPTKFRSGFLHPTHITFNTISPIQADYSEKAAVPKLRGQCGQSVYFDGRKFWRILTSL